MSTNNCFLCCPNNDSYATSTHLNVVIMEVLNAIDGRADMLLSETCAIVIGLLVINVKSTTAHRDHAIFFLKSYLTSSYGL